MIQFIGVDAPNELSLADDASSRGLFSLGTSNVTLISSSVSVHTFVPSIISPSSFKFHYFLWVTNHFHLVGSTPFLKESIF